MESLKRFDNVKLYDVVVTWSDGTGTTYGAVKILSLKDNIVLKTGQFKFLINLQQTRYVKFIDLNKKIDTEESQ
jgi:hypothetical protein